MNLGRIFFGFALLYIFSYLVFIKLGINGIVQELRYLIFLVNGIVLLSVLSMIKISLRRLDYYLICLFVIFYIISSLRHPVTVTSNLKMLFYVGIFLLFFHVKFPGYVTMEKYQDYLSLMIISVSFYQLMRNDLEFINGVNRLSGPYYKHASGYALFLSMWIGTYFARRFNWNVLVIIVLLYYFLLRTGSRSALIASIFGAFYVLNGRVNAPRKILGILLVFACVIIFGNLLLQLDAFYRIRYLIEHGGDGSAMSRLQYVTSLLEKDGFSFMQIRGGYTPILLESIHGKRIGSHNNFLLFYIEGGLLGLGIYIVHLVYTYKKLLKLENDALMYMYIAFYIGGLLSNNYYYVFPMSLFWAYYGYNLRVNYEKKNNM